VGFIFAGLGKYFWVHDLLIYKPHLTPPGRETVLSGEKNTSTKEFEL